MSTFSRLTDLHNFDLILRSITKKAQEEIILRLGWLNIFNPLKPSFNYSLPLTFWDNRTLLVTLLEMGKADGEEQLKDDPHTDISLAGKYVVHVALGVPSLYFKMTVIDYLID